MRLLALPNQLAAVALLAEGVDRNKVDSSAFSQRHKVALLAEGVDRNAIAAVVADLDISRPPRGGRG